MLLIDLEGLGCIHLDHCHPVAILSDGDPIPSVVVPAQVVQHRSEENDSRADCGQMLVREVDLVSLRTSEIRLAAIGIVGPLPVLHQVEGPHRPSRLIAFEP